MTTQQIQTLLDSGGAAGNDALWEIALQLATMNERTKTVRLVGPLLAEKRIWRKAKAQSGDTQKVRQLDIEIKLLEELNEWIVTPPL